MSNKAISKKNIHTIGHSNRPMKEFIEMLRNNEIKLLIDVRHYPGSRHNPQFGKERLKRSLKKAGIRYLHMETLGGRRKPDKSSDLNAEWKSPQFRGFADYMQTKEFRDGLKVLIEHAQKKRTAIMCSEALPWRCHRSLISDALLVHGFSVQDIFSETINRPHFLTSFARVYRKKITYPKIQKSA